MGVLAQGTDGAGSIRIPAGFSGAFGFKPSWGRIPQHPASVVETLSHAGPITRTVGDAVQMLEVMLGPDARDRTSMPAEPLGLDEIEVWCGWAARGLVADLGYAAVDAQVVETAQAAARRFSDLGCTIEEAHPAGEDPWRLVHVLWSTAFAATFRDQFDQIADRLDLGLRAVIEEGFEFRGTDVAGAYIERNAYYHQWREFYENYDLLLTPDAAGHRLCRWRRPPRLGRRPRHYLPELDGLHLPGEPHRPARCQRALRPRRWPARGPANYRRLASGSHRVARRPRL